MRHAGRKNNAIPGLQLHLHATLVIQGSPSKQQSTASPENSIELVCDGMEVMCRVVFKDPAFDPVVRFDGSTYRLRSGVCEDRAVDQDWEARVRDVRCWFREEVFFWRRTCC